MATGHGGGGGGDFVGEILATVLEKVWIILLIVISCLFILIFCEEIIKKLSGGVTHVQDSISSTWNGWFDDEPRVKKRQRPKPVVDQICAGSAEHPETFGIIAKNLTGTVLPEYGAAFQALAAIESEGNYAALGPKITDKGSMYYGDRAYGRYQIMGKNIPAWSKEVLDVDLTPEQFLTKPGFQDAIAYHKVVETWKRRDGNILDVAATWQSGGTFAAAEKSGVGDGITPTVKYARIVEKTFNERLAACKSGGIDWSGTYAFPTDCRSMSSDFGLRTNPETGKGQKFHHGLDIGKCPARAKNYATIAGKVTHADPKNMVGKCGIMVEIEGKAGGHDVKTRYCHFAKGTLKVKKGDMVKAGDVLGIVGTTGHKSGPHCHLEVHIDKETVDVESWFKAVGIKPPYQP